VKGLDYKITKKELVELTRLDLGLKGLYDFKSNVEGTIGQLSSDGIKQLYEKIVGPEKMKKLNPSDEEIRRSILHHAQHYPKEMREHVKSVLDSCPEPPECRDFPP
jgi:hypothetical protein